MIPGSMFPPEMTLQQAAELCARENLTASIEWVREGDIVHMVVRAARSTAFDPDLPAFLRRQAE